MNSYRVIYKEGHYWPQYKTWTWGRWKPCKTYDRVVYDYADPIDFTERVIKEPFGCPLKEEAIAACKHHYKQDKEGDVVWTSEY